MQKPNPVHINPYIAKPGMKVFLNNYSGFAFCLNVETLKPPEKLDDVGNYKFLKK